MRLLTVALDRGADCQPEAAVEPWPMERSGHAPGFLPRFRSAIMERLSGREGE